MCTRVNEHAKALAAQAHEGFMRVRHVLMPASGQRAFMAAVAKNAR
ncbi:hypothetical protein SSKA14_2433 [Stenotrophomonas sp. SKA14]|nr:hypothetical protein SSKA14_2433 [Stenotrophomonas sp. SKA14]